jgi:acyl-CoA synthetase (AMP-forming)/AMP-acid ligase II
MSSPTTQQFDLSKVFHTIAVAIPDETAVVWRDRRLSYANLDARIDAVARYLASRGLGCHTEREALPNHTSGQDHLGIYLRNGNEYLEAMLGSYRARVAPFNVNYRYVADELVYLLNNAGARALIYAAEFAGHVAAIRTKVPGLEVLVQVDDGSRNELLTEAIDYETMIRDAPRGLKLPAASPDDLYLLYTGGTTGMPKGVMWRQHDIFVSSMGGRLLGKDTPPASYDELSEQATRAPGTMTMLIMLPFMHGAGQFGAMTAFAMGGRIVIPDTVDRLDAAEVLSLAEREQVLTIPVIGDSITRPLVQELETGNYDLSSLVSITNTGAAITAGVSDRLRTALPHVLLMNGVGGSETGLQLTAVVGDDDTTLSTFTPQPDTAVISDDFSRVLTPGEGLGWLARCRHVPLGYLGDETKSAQTFPVIDGVRWSVPGDRANYLSDGRIELLGRDSMMINSGGEKIFVEEVERAVAAHPGVDDVVVAGRASPRWGNEVVAIIQVAPGQNPTDQELRDVCATRIARYKLPKAFVRVESVPRSPSGKADYRWAQRVASNTLIPVEATSNGN